MGNSGYFGFDSKELERAIEQRISSPTETSSFPDDKTEFDVILTSVGVERLNVLRVVRELTYCGLQEAKNLVDNIPSSILKNVERNLAIVAKSKLESVGATVILN